MFKVAEIVPSIPKMASNRSFETEIRWREAQASDSAFRAITRREFFDIVWSMPMGQAALEIGASTRGLARFCKMAGVPVPGRGFWRSRTRVAAMGGRPTLPEPAIGLPDFVLEIEKSAMGEPIRCGVRFPMDLIAVRSGLLTILEHSKIGSSEVALHNIPERSRMARGGMGVVSQRRSQLIHNITRSIEAIGGFVSAGVESFPSIDIVIGSQRISIRIDQALYAKNQKYSTEYKPKPNLSELRIVELSTSYSGRVIREWNDEIGKALEDRISEIVIELSMGFEARCRHALVRHISYIK